MARLKIHCKFVYANLRIICALVEHEFRNLAILAF